MSETNYYCYGNYTTHLDSGSVELANYSWYTNNVFTLTTGRTYTIEQVKHKHQRPPKLMYADRQSSSYANPLHLSTIALLPSLDHRDADVNLLKISNYAQHPSPNNDPLYSTNSTTSNADGWFERTTAPRHRPRRHRAIPNPHPRQNLLPTKRPLQSKHLSTAALATLANLTTNISEQALATSDSPTFAGTRRPPLLRAMAHRCRDETAHHIFLGMM